MFSRSRVHYLNLATKTFKAVTVCSQRDARKIKLGHMQMVGWLGGGGRGEEPYKLLKRALEGLEEGVNS